jgi:hypothetical protein
MPRRRACLPALLVLAALVGPLAACRPRPAVPRSAIPAGWTERSRTRYDRDTLYDYVDGGADRYLKKGFRGLTATRYADAAGDEITVDAYDLGTAANAAALQAETKLPQARPFGAGDAALAHDYGVHCRHGGLYVEITTPRAGPALAAAAAAFARAACR